MQLSRKSTVVVIMTFFMLLLLASVIHHQLNLILMETYRSYPSILFVGLLYFPAGVVLGLFQFLSQKNNQGKWAVQYLYLQGLGIPCLYLMNYTIWHFFFIFVT